MVGIFALFSTALAAQLAVATPIQSRTPYAVKETHHLPRQWKSVGQPPSGEVLHLKIALKQGQFAELERHLYEVSDPRHSRYGKHLSVDDVYRLVSPKDETLNLVHEWLSDNGITAEKLSYSNARDWISVHLPLADVEKLLDTKYQVYEHEDGRQLSRTLGWSLPRHLHAHIDAIQPTTSFLRGSRQYSNALDLEPIVPAEYKALSNPEIAKVCNVSSVTPQCFQALYKTKGYKVKFTRGENKVAFTNYLGEIPIRPDAALFAKKYRPDALGQTATFPQKSIAGGLTQDGPLTYNQSTVEGISQEANLDVQAILGISNPVPVVSYSTGGSPPFKPDINTPTNTNEPYLVWLNYILGQRDIPNVISTSYADDEQTVPIDYARRVCQEFAQLGARGVSVLFASGDRGVGVNGTCLSNDGKNTTQFVPLFPSGCPYVTTVGATHEFEPEVVAYRPATVRPDGSIRLVYSSGGGFSNYFETPKYQKETVQKYVKKLKGEFDGLYNKKGRAYPDIAGQGQYFAYFWNGTEGVISGTSASTPLISGIVSLLNDARLAADKPPLGFLNPWIYADGASKGFTDITSGSAVGCETRGFPALDGWDPVTGFGTPIFTKLVDLIGGRW